MKAESKNRALGKFFQNQVGQYYFRIDENNALVILNWAYDLSNSQEPPKRFALFQRVEAINTHIFTRYLFVADFIFRPPISYLPTYFVKMIGQVSIHIWSNLIKT